MRASWIGDRIHRLRAERGWSQRELAKRSGVDASLISLLEKGEVKSPTVDTAQRIAAAFGMTVDDFLSGKPLPPGGVAVSTDGERVLSPQTRTRLRAALRAALIEVLREEGFSPSDASDVLAEEAEPPTQR